jgi:hypothetical protein
MTVPDWYITNGIPTDSPATAPGFQARYLSYEYRASCAGTNMGAGLQAGASTLFDEGRREGAVWIMVLLSDGAAGASNPISAYNSVPIVAPDPYNTINPVTTTGYDYDGTTQLTYYDPVTDSDLPVPIQTGLTVYDPVKGTGGPAITNPNNSGGYGAYGLCPYGTETKPSQLISGNGGDHFPNCDDLHPETRHFCNPQAAEPDFVLDGDPNCFKFYDVDDYARDWADYVGLAQLPGVKLDANTGRVGDQLVPSIFTIGFGLNYAGSSSCGSDDYDCIRGISSGLTADCDARPNQSQKNTCLGPILDRNADYLGEELLRYIADVGDNNQIDNDWWQLCESAGAPSYTGVAYTGSCRDDVNDDGTAKINSEDRIGNPVDLTTFNWGARGACEQPDNYNLRGEFWNPKPPTVQCGSYYNATTRQQLDAVFDTIASRMFTRLSQ